MAKKSNRGRTHNNSAIAINSTTVPSEPLRSRLRGTDGGNRALPNIEGASSNDFKYKSDSEIIIDNSVDEVIANGEQIKKRVLKAVEKHGRKVFVCPFCPRDPKKNEFASPSVCNSHIKREHRARLQELKLAKAPKTAYAPREETRLSREERFKAVVTPKMAKYMQSAAEAREITAPLREKQLHESGKGGFNATTFIQATEGVAISNIKTLSPQQLKEVYTLAQNRGKRMLARACRKRLDDIPADQLTRDSGAGLRGRNIRPGIKPQIITA